MRIRIWIRRGWRRRSRIRLGRRTAKVNQNHHYTGTARGKATKKVKGQDKKVKKKGKGMEWRVTDLMPTNFELRCVPTRILMRRSLYVPELRLVGGSGAVDI
jgi:hypothetical protein